MCNSLLVHGVRYMCIRERETRLICHIELFELILPIISGVIKFSHLPLNQLLYNYLYTRAHTYTTRMAAVATRPKTADWAEDEELEGEQISSDDLQRKLTE